MEWTGGSIVNWKEGVNERKEWMEGRGRCKKRVDGRKGLMKGRS